MMGLSYTGAFMYLVLHTATSNRVTFLFFPEQYHNHSFSTGLPPEANFDINLIVLLNSLIAKVSDKVYYYSASIGKAPWTRNCS